MEAVSTPHDLTALKGKSALITGGASGIGLATARVWAGEGAYVTIADVQSDERGAQLVSEISATGGHINYVFCDVTSWDSQVAAFKSAVKFSPYQTLDIVATFAGTAFAAGNEVDHVMMAGEPSLEHDPKVPDTRNIDINLTGVYYTSWLALYYFRLKPKRMEVGAGGATNGIPNAPDTNGASSSPDKSLVMVASIGAYMDSPKASTYPASKFGVRGLFRSTRARTMDIGVRCNLLAPWFVDTPLIAPIKNAMASRGMDMAKMLSFASVDSCVEAASLCAVDTKLHGRALAIQPEGTFDLKDDYEDGWAGDQLRPIMKRRREAGFDA